MRPVSFSLATVMTSCSLCRSFPSLDFKVTKYWVNRFSDRCADLRRPHGEVLSGLETKNTSPRRGKCHHYRRERYKSANLLPARCQKLCPYRMRSHWEIASFLSAY